jgi:TetR/AcrR family transcriptional regulator, transcriptional repressor for nem operon
MARLREFDIDEAMEAIINAFWERGYEATSLADLMAVTGLQKGSLYKAFGDKRSLFLRALQTYLDRQYSLIREILSQPDPQQAIVRMLQFLADSTDRENKGCFAVNSLMELAPHDPEVAKMLEYQFYRVGKLLEKVLDRGQKTGVFRQDLSGQQLRQWLLVTMNGMLASQRATFLQLDLPAIADAVLAVLKA